MGLFDQLTLRLFIQITSGFLRLFIQITSKFSEVIQKIHIKYFEIFCVYDLKFWERTKKTMKQETHKSQAAIGPFPKTHFAHSPFPRAYPFQSPCPRTLHGAAFQERTCVLPKIYCMRPLSRNRLPCFPKSVYHVFQNGYSKAAAGWPMTNNAMAHAKWAALTFFFMKHNFSKLVLLSFVFFFNCFGLGKTLGHIAWAWFRNAFAFLFHSMFFNFHG